MSLTCNTLEYRVKNQFKVINDNSISCSWSKVSNAGKWEATKRRNQGCYIRLSGNDKSSGSYHFLYYTVVLIGNKTRIVTY